MQEEGSLSPCAHSHSDPDAVSKVGDTQVRVQKGQKWAKNGVTPIGGLGSQSLAHG